MITLTMFCRLIERIEEDLRLSGSKLELIDIRTDFNHKTAKKAFIITIQLPDGRHVVRRVEEG